MGTPDFVVPIFDRIASRHEIIAVFTRAPKPVGRKKIITKTPVHIWAESKGIPVFTNINKLTNHAPRIPNPDYILVAAYGVILKREVLDFAPCLNIHPSMLPKYRGASPIVSAILSGDSETGVCLMNMAPEVDAGDILMRENFPIGENDSTADVERKVSDIAGDMTLRYLDAPEKFPPAPQVGEPTFTRKITSDDMIIDWKKTPREIHNQIRAIGGRTTVNGIDVKITRTKIEDGELKIETVQPAGKKEMAWADFMNGQHGKCDIN
jgi:methionyl-tRNA formyltransferase